MLPLNSSCVREPECRLADYFSRTSALHAGECLAHLRFKRCTWHADSVSAVHMQGSNALHKHGYERSPDLFVEAFENFLNINRRNTNASCIRSDATSIFPSQQPRRDAIAWHCQHRCARLMFWTSPGRAKMNLAAFKYGKCSSLHSVGRRKLEVLDNAFAGQKQTCKRGEGVLREERSTDELTCSKISTRSAAYYMQFGWVRHDCGCSSPVP
jgi:hypothetical protein